MIKFCPRCGSTLQSDWKICPNCGVKVVNLPEQDLTDKNNTIYQPIRSGGPKALGVAKKTRLKWAEKSWIISLIAGILGIASLLTPFLSVRWIDGAGVLVFSFDQWWFGFNASFQHPITYDFYWTKNPFYLIPEIITFIAVLLSNLTILIIALRLHKIEKNSSKGLIGGIVGLLISSIVIIIIFDLLTWNISGFSMWEARVPGFALIWQFIGSILVFIGYFLGRNRKPQN